jgi:hypothetical protein
MGTMTLIAMLLQALQAIPYVGPVIVFGLNLVLPLSAVMSAFVGCWQGVVLLLQALGSIPMLGFFKTLATKLAADEAVVNGVINNNILPFIKQLSAIPIPTKVLAVKL